MFVSTRGRAEGIGGTTAGGKLCGVQGGDALGIVVGGAVDVGGDRVGLEIAGVWSEQQLQSLGGCRGVEPIGIVGGV